ncbi:MAG TPA: undecaprenyl-diphosphate phosphatase [Bacteroidota bacterium]|nr:undecaprenyl-diphosphate phosphatase [Bacteroidota bacterium]
MGEIIKALILGVVEGITEFLPISSTGHLILVNRFVSFTGEFTKMFDIVIQLGAILSIIVYFWKRLYPFGKSVTPDSRRDIWDIWKKAIVGVLPAIVIGASLGRKIEESLFNPLTVMLALFAGGILIIVAEKRRTTARIQSVGSLKYSTVVSIGFIQCLAMIPGTSRSAATIVGAMLLGASRTVAAEFSFFLAIPTMVAASGYSLLKHGSAVTGPEWVVLATGFAAAFFVAWGVVAFLMNYIRKHDFIPFGYYRIALAILVAVFMYRT